MYMFSFFHALYSCKRYVVHDRCYCFTLKCVIIVEFGEELFIYTCKTNLGLKKGFQDM